MLQIRHSTERGRADHGWLQSQHSFSFADYYDPEHTGFGPLLVINEDRVAPGMGFGTHGHRDMEIISYVLDGALEHKDSMGNGSVLRPGDVQRMSAGSGVRHSEYNHSRQEPVHFLQIWIAPNERGIAPGYEEAHFAPSDKLGRLRLIASPDGREGSVRIHQDARLFAALPVPGQRIEYTLASARKAYVHVVRGQISVNGTALGPGDAAKLSEETSVVLDQASDAEVLLFDLPA
ncbi:pirin family protein [Massilia sp. TS11]|uniref:pirin family protein n=1 Tax=Massilia sp. TS11 TaxID=2908003 RepID=UPI001EDB4D14|nr:pirin family protein [Massilia sp. TS11]MCG2583263.1 pirin family protein [Massilia sp. TS11]